MTISDFSFHSQSTNSDIYRISIVPEGGEGVSRGTVLALHGLGDNTSCHENAFKIFHEMGYRVEGFDWPGNGSSGGTRGDIPGVKPAIRLIWEVIESLAEKPVAIYAHSTGAFLVLPFLLRYGSQLPLDWIWFSSPLLRPTHKQSKLKQWASRVLARWLPRVTIPTGVRPSRCYHVNDLNAVAVVREFKYCHSKISLRFGRDLLLWEPRVVSAAHALKDPLRVLVTQGEEDLICPHQYAEAFFDEISATHKTMLSFADLRHEPLREPDNGEFIKQVSEWLHENSTTKAN